MRTYGGSILGGGGSPAGSAGPVLRFNEEVLPPPFGSHGVEESLLRSRLRLRSLALRFPTANECAHGGAYCSAR